MPGPISGSGVANGGPLGTPSSGVVTNLTGTANININGTVGATTPGAGTFTTGVFGSTTSLLLGTAGSAVGNIDFRNATSGTATLAPPTGALGTYTATLPNAASILPIFGQQVTFAGPTAPRTITLPDAAFTVARTDATNTFIGTQIFGGTISLSSNTIIGDSAGLSLRTVTNKAFYFDYGGTSAGGSRFRNFDSAFRTDLAIDGVNGNIGAGVTAWGTSAAKVVGIGNGTEPSTSPIDMIQLYSVDLSAGNATLGLRTETAVVTEVVVSDSTLSVRINGVTYKICLKS